MRMATTSTGIWPCGTPFVIAVVVTYRPDLGILEDSLRAVRPQVGNLLVVDNGSEEYPLHRLRALADSLDICVIEHGDNLGLGRAHNAGIGFALERGATHVLLLDQDSVPAPDMVMRLLAAQTALADRGERVSAVGPRYYGRKTGVLSSFVRFGVITFTRADRPLASVGSTVRTDFLISSGSLFTLASLCEVGCMDETLFIDHVDTEWFLRARAAGFSAFGVDDAIMTHDLGGSSVRFWLGRWRNVARHSPVRHYYIFRNSVLLWRRRYAPARWIWNDFVRLSLMFVIFGIATSPRIKHARMMLRGLHDGLAGRAGRADRMIESHSWNTG